MYVHVVQEEQYEVSLFTTYQEEYESSVGSSGTTTPDRQVEPEEQGGDGGGGGGGPVPTGSQHASPLVTSFYMIRVVTLPPTAIVWLAFPAGVSGATRNQARHGYICNTSTIDFANFAYLHYVYFFLNRNSSV